MEVVVLRGVVPSDLDGSGYGYGYGDGDGYGDGYGYGSGYGSGSGDGDGSGSGDGYGYGYGYGYGSGYGSGSGDGDGYGDVISCRPQPSRVTLNDLKKADACAEQARVFARIFPDGATWPDDIIKAEAAGLNVQWATERLGLLRPRGGHQP